MEEKNSSEQGNNDAEESDAVTDGEEATSAEDDVQQEASATEEAQKDKMRDSSTNSADEEDQADTTTTPSPTAEADKQSDMPTSVGTTQKYVVQKGDTLSKISKTYYGSTKKIHDICQLNQLDSEDLIYAGQIILLP